MHLREVSTSGIIRDKIPQLTACTWAPNCCGSPWCNAQSTCDLFSCSWEWCEGRGFYICEAYLYFCYVPRPQFFQVLLGSDPDAQSYCVHRRFRLKSWDKQIWVPTRYYGALWVFSWLLGKHPLLTKLGWW